MVTARPFRQAILYGRSKISIWRLYEMEQRGIASALAKEGIPMLYIETDYSPRDTGQLLTRIEALLDSIRSRRRKS